MTDVTKAIARLDAASVEMKSALDAMNHIWRRTMRGEAPLSADEIRACREAGARARRSADR